MVEKQRVIAYIDGFNLYFGLKSNGWHRYYWIDVCKLAKNLTLPTNELVSTKYFTSRISGPPDKIRRQNLFLEANQATSNPQVILGQYFKAEFKCPSCAVVSRMPTEKMTDVNIATEMLGDAFQDLFDTALLVSGDSDLTAPVRKIRHLFPHKRVVVAFPPNRVSNTLIDAASAHLSIGKPKLSDSLMPEKVVKPDGYVIERPSRWK